jgi:hypothetical protein
MKMLEMLSVGLREMLLQEERCIIASTYTVYNTLADNSPHVIRILAQPDWPFAT